MLCWSSSAVPGFESPCQPCPALTWALPCAPRCTGVTCHTGNMHLAPLGRLQRFWISEECQSPLRLFFLFYFPFFSLSHIQCELEDPFQVFLRFVRAGKRLRELGVWVFFLRTILFPLFLRLTAYMDCNANFPQIPTKKFLGQRQIGAMHFKVFNYFLGCVAAAVVCFPIEMDIYTLPFG